MFRCAIAVASGAAASLLLLLLLSIVMCACCCVFRSPGALTFGYGCTVHVGVDVGAGDIEVGVIYTGISLYMVITYSRVWINRVRLPILLVVS